MDLILFAIAFVGCAWYGLYRWAREYGIDLFVGEDQRPLRNIEEWD